MQRNRGKQQNGKDKRFLKENQRQQGNNSPKDGTVKDRNVMYLRGAEEIKKKWQEYTEELYKKDLMTWTATIVQSNRARHCGM